MRNHFFTALADVADNDERIVVLTADLGYGCIDAFSARHPARFINVGVAEQNMVGVATGLAEAGFIPFCYSITPFAVLRPLEFILRGPLLHSLPVRIVGAGRGQEYGVNGCTHWADEAEKVITALGIYCRYPGTAPAVKWVVENSLHRTGPMFISLSKGACADG